MCSFILSRAQFAKSPLDYHRLLAICRTDLDLKFVFFVPAARLLAADVLPQLQCNEVQNPDTLIPIASLLSDVIPVLISSDTDV